MYFRGIDLVQWCSILCSSLISHLLERWGGHCSLLCALLSDEGALEALAAALLLLRRLLGRVLRGCGPHICRHSHVNSLTRSSYEYSAWRAQVRCATVLELLLYRVDWLLAGLCSRLRGASDGMRFHSRHNFSDNIAQRDMQKFLAFEPIDVVCGVLACCCTVSLSLFHSILCLTVWVCLMTKFTTMHSCHAHTGILLGEWFRPCMVSQEETLHATFPAAGAADTERARQQCLLQRCWS